MRPERVLLCVVSALALVIGWSGWIAAADTAEPKAQPVAEPKAEPKAEPIVQPKAEPGAEPTAEPKGEPPVEPKAPPSLTPTADPKALEIVDRYLKARGGREAVGAIKSIQMEIWNLKHSDVSTNKAKILHYMKGQRMIREDWDMEDIQVGALPLRWTQTFDGRKGWVQMFGKVSPLEGKTLFTFLWDKYVDDFFLHWQKDGFSLTSKGQEQIGGKACDVLIIEDFMKSQKTRYLFDPETGFYAKKEWEGQSPTGKTKNEAYYKEWRPVAIKLPDGTDAKVSFSFTVETFEDGVLTGERKLQSVRLNPDLPDELFGRPAGEDFKPITGADTKKAEGKKGEEKKGPPVGLPLPGLKGGAKPEPEPKAEPKTEEKPAPKPEEKPAEKPAPTPGETPPPKAE